MHPSTLFRGMTSLKRDLDQPVQALKKEVHRHGITYKELASRTGLSLNHLKNLMSGRAILQITDRDKICSVLGVNPGDIVLQRGDVIDTSVFLDIRTLPPNVQDALRCLTDTLIQLHPAPRKRRRRAKAA